MRKYALKLSRDTRTGAITVGGIYPAPPGMTPMRVKWSSYHAETVQVFDTREEAEAARRAELEAARLSTLPDLEQLFILKNRYDRVREVLGPSGFTFVRRLAGVPIDTVDSYFLGRLRPNPRTIARIKIVADRLLELVEDAQRLLPQEGQPGTPSRRKGNPRIAYIRRNHPARETPAPA